jgi:hypothetical protein
MNMFQFLGLALAAGLVGAVGTAGTSAPGAREGGDHQAHFMACAKACADCSVQCDSCYQHCTHKVIGGSKEHAKSMELCVDCAEVCRLGATLAGRHSKLAVPACEFCAKTCDECASACEAFKDDKHMTDCAKACHDCAKACREMVKMVKK